MDLGKSLAEFGWDLCKEIHKTQSDANILVSPLSIGFALTLLSLAANGDTKSQIKKLLHFQISDLELATCLPKANNTLCGEEQINPKSGQEGSNPEALNQIKEFYAKLKSTGDTELRMANLLFTEINFPILKTFQTTAQEVFQTNMKSVDFGKDETSKDINTWFEQETNGTIKNFFPPNSLSKEMSMIIANGIYLKGKWTKKFKKEDTKDAQFKVKEGVFKTVPMMSQTDTFNYADLEDINAQVIELPYGNGDLSMVIILPKETTNVDKVFEQMTFDKLLRCINPKNLQATRVELFIPRFKIEDNYDLTSHLQNMGMTDAFSKQKADFSMMSNIGLFVSKVNHKTYIEVVDEDGREARGATGAVILPQSLKPPLELIINRPVLFVIIASPIQRIIFISKLSSPSA